MSCLHYKKEREGELGLGLEKHIPLPFGESTAVHTWVRASGKEHVSAKYLGEIFFF